MPWLTTHVAALDEDVSPALERMVASHEAHPVFVLDHKWDVVRSNRIADVVFHYGDTMAPLWNVLESTFDEKGRARFVNWHEVAECLVELFCFDYAAYAHDADSIALVGRLRATDADFAAVWEAHRVRRGSTARCELASSEGVLTLEPLMVGVLESPGLRCLIFTPFDVESAQRIRRLAAAPRLADGSPLPAAIRLC